MTVIISWYFTMVMWYRVGNDFGGPADALEDDKGLHPGWLVVETLG